MSEDARHNGCWWLLFAALGCGSAAPEIQTPAGEAKPPSHANLPQSVRALDTPTAATSDPPLPADERDVYAEAEEELVAVEGFCFLAAPGVSAHVAPFDGGVGVLLTSAQQSDRLRVDAQRLAGKMTTVTPVSEAPLADFPVRAALEDERVFVAGSDEPSADDPHAFAELAQRPDQIAVSVSVQEAPNGVMLLIVPEDSARSGELMRRVQADVAVLADGACLAKATPGAEEELIGNPTEGTDTLPAETLPTETLPAPQVELD